MKTDEHWETHAKSDPYWAVVTWDCFKGNVASSPALLEEFFNTGRSYINTIFEIIASSISPAFDPKTVLDFGCGVGRLLLPLAERGLEVSGVDISKEMLRLARQNLHSHNFSIKSTTRSLGDLPAESKYDLVHTFIVLQHIPAKRGLKIIDQLLDRVSSHGVIVFHITYSARKSIIGSVRQTAINFAKDIISSLSPLSAIYKLLKGKNVTPPMLMENYQLNRIFFRLSENSFNNIHVRHSSHGGTHGLLIFAQQSHSIPHPTYF